MQNRLYKLSHFHGVTNHARELKFELDHINRINKLLYKCKRTAHNSTKYSPFHIFLTKKHAF